MESNTFLERILGLVCSVFDAYSAVMFLPDTSTDGLRLAAKFSLGDAIVAGTVITHGQGVVGWIAKERKPLLINNVEKKRSRLGYYSQGEEETIKAFMGCPLQGGGALCLDSKRTYSFSDKDQRILQLFAELSADINSQCVMAQESRNDYRYYHCLQLIQSLRRRSTRWNDFLSHFLDLVAETSGMDHCCLAVRDEWGGKYYLEGWNQKLFQNADHDIRFDIGAGLVGWVFKNGSSVFSSESKGVSPLFGKAVETQQFSAALGLPLYFNKSTRGVLCMASSQPIVLTDSLKIFAQMAADYLALFLENLYLKSKLHEARQSTADDDRDS